jgi:hypothetical protein
VLFTLSSRLVQFGGDYQDFCLVDRLDEGKETICKSIHVYGS